MRTKNKPSKALETKKSLIERVRKVKKDLPSNWRKKLVDKHPEYDALEFADFLRNVHSLRVADEPLTIILETIASEYQAELVKKEKFAEKTIRRQKIYIPPTI